LLGQLEELFLGHSRLFWPALANSLIGLLSTLINVYIVQRGKYSPAAMAMLAMGSGVAIVGSVGFLVFGLVKGNRVRNAAIVEERRRREGQKKGNKGGRWC